MWRWLQNWRQKRTHRGLRVLRWLGRLIFYPLFFFLLLSAVLLSTGPGSHLVASLVSATIPGLQLDYKAGRLNQEIALHYFELDLGFLFIAIEDVRLDWNPWCSLQNKLCVNEVEAKSLVLKLNSVNRRKNSKPGPPHNKHRLMQLPFDIEVQQGRVQQGDLRIYDIQIDWQQADVAVYLTDGLVDVKKAHMDSGAVHVKASQTQQSTPNGPGQSKVWGDSYWPLTHLPETYLPLQLRLPDVQANQFNLTIGPYRTDHFSQVQLSGHWQKLDAYIQQIKFNHHDYGQLALAGSAQLKHPYPLRIEAHALPNQLPWFSELTGSDWDLSLQGSLDELRIHAQENSQWNWQLDGKGQFSQINLPFELSFKGHQMIWPDPIPAPIQYQDIDGQLSGDLTSQKFKLNSTVETTYEGLTVQAKVQAQGRYQAQQLWLDHINANYLQQPGGLSGQGYLSHQDKLSWRTTLELDQVILPQFALAEPLQLSGHLEHQGNYHQDHWFVGFKELGLLGRYQNQIIEVQGEIGFNQLWQGKAKDFIASYSDHQLTLNGTADENWQLQAEFSSPDVAGVVPNLTGPLNVTLDVEGLYQDPLIYLQVQSERFAYQQFKGLDLFATSHYRPKKQDQITLDVGLNKARIEGIELQDIQLSLQGDRQSHALELSTQGDVQSLFTFQGQLNKEYRHWQGVLNQGEIGGHAGLWQSESDIPLAIELSPARFKLALHCWISPKQSKVCLEKNASLGNKGTLDASFQLNTLDFSPYLMPEAYNLSGLLLGQGKASWSQQQPLSLTAHLSAEQILVNYSSLVEGEIQHTALEHLQLDLNLNPLRSQVLLDIASTEQDGILLNAELDHQKQNEISGQLQIHNYQLGRFNNLFPDLNKMRGQINGRLKLAGQLASPLLDGWLQIRNGNLELLSNPTPIEQLQLYALFTGQQVQLNSDFRLGGGEAQVQALADWQQQLKVDASLKGSELKVLIPPRSTVSLSPELTYQYDQGQSSLKGSIYAPKADLKLSQLAGDAVAISDDVVFVDEFGPVHSNNSRQLETNIQLTLGPKVKLQAFGLTGRLEGAMDLKQSNATPLQIFGHASFHEAIFAAYGQRLNIEEKSSLHFNGEPKKANLDVRATRFIKTENVTAGLHLSGTVEKPKITFFSDPAMDQQEILSYIIRGKGFKDEGVNNPQSMAAMVGVSAISTLGVNKPLEKLPGISSVSLDTEGEGDETQVTISGYLGDRIFLKYGIGVFEPINEVTVRLYLMNQLWLESVTGLEKSLDLYYSFFID